MVSELMAWGRVEAVSSKQWYQEMAAMAMQLVLRAAEHNAGPLGTNGLTVLALVFIRRTGCLVTTNRLYPEPKTLLFY